MIGVRHWFYAAVPLTAAFFSLVLLGQSLWIPLKAEVAHWLIERSWQRSLEGEIEAPPWPWADTRAAGILTVPGRGIRQMILEGNSGRNLAFGPVILNHTGHSEDLVLSGHRDTHFRFLKDLRTGDQVHIQLPDGTRYFEVIQLDIVDSTQAEMVIEPGVKRLSLVTCYPFDSMAAGGPQRYVVTALPVEPQISRRHSPSSG